LLYGDGQEEPPFDMANPGATFTHAYTDPGTYRVRARGAGVTAIQCANGPQDAFVSVRFGPIITPEGDEGLKPLQPKLETAPARGGLKPLPPTLNRDKGRTIKPFPKITVHQFEPAVKNGNLVWAAPDILAPGGRLILGGEGFGVNPGNIYMWGLGPDPVILENAFWSGRQVHGILPASLGGAPGVRTPVTVAVYNSNLKKWSPGIELEYENPFASRRLTMSDPSVRVVACGNDGNYNRCNQIDISADDCGGAAGVLDIRPGVRRLDPEPAIDGFHYNCGTIGDDAGTDKYEIHLANGWFIHRIVEQKADKSSEHEEVTFSKVPTGVGASNATISVDWTVTPNGDSVQYWLRLEALGPIGTEPF
jgi:hypothetical protein